MKLQKNLQLSAVRVKDTFWGNIQKLVQDVVIPFQADILEDKTTVADKSHAIRNIRIAAKEEKGEFHGMPWQDSDVAKWLEAAAYSIALRPDAELEARMDEVIRLIGKAQRKDGYFNSFFELKEPGQEWTNLRDRHELYCAGHMIEAGVAHHTATGKDSLLTIACGIADNVCKRFGTEYEDKVRGYPGHQEIELALLRLYRTTGNQQYLNTAKYFLDERGKSPNFLIDETRMMRPHETHYNIINTMYQQAHIPVRNQTEAVGHSVRALYMYTAMADLAAETNDAKLYNACKALMNNMIEKKMYITGGLGSTVHGEAFSPEYDLPNDIMYAETCASVAMCFFARRMLEIKPCGIIADVLERQLFNVVLASMQMDGKRFFYVNPLEVVPSIAGVAQTHKHVLPTRPNWFACACCPPNVSRLLLSIGRYAWGEGEGTLYAHFALGGRAQFNSGVSITCETGYPWDGNTHYTIDTNAEFTFAVHIPSWCTSTSFTINGQPQEYRIIDGYVHISRQWLAGDKLAIINEMPAQRIYSNLQVSGNIGKVALQRGPIVYCIEEADNGENLAAISLSPTATITEQKGSGIFEGTILLHAEGTRSSGSESLYTTQPHEKAPHAITAVPYYLWGNRTPGEMRVWVQE